MFRNIWELTKLSIWTWCTTFLEHGVSAGKSCWPTVNNAKNVAPVHPGGTEWGFEKDKSVIIIIIIIIIVMARNDGVHYIRDVITGGSQWCGWLPTVSCRNRCPRISLDRLIRRIIPGAAFNPHNALISRQDLSENSRNLGQSPIWGRPGYEYDWGGNLAGWNSASSNVTLPECNRISYAQHAEWWSCVGRNKWGS